MARVTTHGLQSSSQGSAALPAVQWAEAAGSANVITAAFDTEITALTDGLIVGIRHGSTNTSETPTLAADDTGSKTIVKGYGAALEPGDVPAEAFYRYNLGDDVWVLMNPDTHYRQPTASWAVAGGTVSAITAAFVPAHGVLGAADDGLEFTIRMAGANVITTPTLALDLQTALTIKKLGAQALALGDIYGANHEAQYKYHYHASAPWFELLNPATGADLTPYSFKQLTADGATFADDTAVHAVGLTVTLAVGTYRLRGRIHTTRVAGTNSHTTSLLFAGSATYTIKGNILSRGGDADALAAVSGLGLDILTAQVVKAASTSATEDVNVSFDATIIVTVAGTVFPELQYSVAPGGVTTPKAGSYLEAVPRINPQGTWT